MSRAHRAQPSKDLILPFFFFDYYIRITESNHASRTPNTRNSVLFQPIHIRVRNLQRNEPMYHTVTLSFSNQWPVRTVYLTPPNRIQCLLLSHFSRNVLFFEHMHYFFGTRSTRCIILNKATLAIFTRATLRAPLRIPPCCHLRRYSHRLAVAEAILRSLFVTPPER